MLAQFLVGGCVGQRAKVNWSQTNGRTKGHIETAEPLNWSQTVKRTQGRIETADPFNWSQTDGRT